MVYPPANSVDDPGLSHGKWKPVTEEEMGALESIKKKYPHWGAGISPNIPINQDDVRKTLDRVNQVKDDLYRFRRRHIK